MVFSSTCSNDLLSPKMFSTLYFFFCVLDSEPDKKALAIKVKYETSSGLFHVLVSPSSLVSFLFSFFSYFLCCMTKIHDRDIGCFFYLLQSPLEYDFKENVESGIDDRVNYCISYCTVNSICIFKLVSTNICQ